MNRIERSVPALLLCIHFAGAGCAASTRGPIDDATQDSAVVVDASDVSPAPCGSGIEIEITQPITSDERWTCDDVYVLVGKIFVEQGATLTIDPGTEVRVRAFGALIVSRGSKLVAAGEAGSPISFTSDRPVGQRAPEDWGGVVLLGGASTNTGAETFFEAGSVDDTRLYYGDGGAGTAADVYDCGTLRHVEIEFAGADQSLDIFHAGLTLAGCGSETEIDHVHVHRTRHDGIQVFGGTTRLSHVVVTGAGDDGIDWRNGWRGRGQFIIVNAFDDHGHRAIEGSNSEGGWLTAPRSAPTLYNLTVVGPGAESARDGVVLQLGTRGIVRNAVVQGFGTTGLDIVPSNGSEADWGTALLVENTFFFEAQIPTGDATFMDHAQVLHVARHNQTAVDPGLAVGTHTAPSYVPTNAALNGQATPPPGFDTSATYAGAVAPNATGADVWYAWMTFPEN